MRASTGPSSHGLRVARFSGGGPPFLPTQRAAAVDRDALAVADRLGVEQQQALFALLDLGQVLLRDGVAVLGHRGDDLIQVRDLAPPQIEDVLAAARGQRLQHRRAVERAQEFFQPLLRTRDQRLGAHVGGEIGQVHAAAGAAQPFGVVDDQRAGQAQAPAEIDERRRRSPALSRTRVVAQQHDVEAAQRVLFVDGVVGRERARVVRGRLVVAVRARAWSWPARCCRRGTTGSRPTRTARRGRAGAPPAPGRCRRRSAAGP